MKPFSTFYSWKKTLLLRANNFCYRHIFSKKWYRQPYKFFVYTVYRAALCCFVFLSPMRFGLYKGKPRKQKIYVSLATYPPRFHCLESNLKSLLLQTVKPDGIFVWLDPDVEISSLPENVLRLSKYGVSFKNCPYALRPHKKYFQMMREAPDDLVITVDDDLLYPPTLVRTLLRLHKEFPSCVCARSVREIHLDENGRPLPYKTWNHVFNTKPKPSLRFLAVGAGGILYPPHCMPSELFHVEKIMETALCVDDLW